MDGDALLRLADRIHRIPAGEATWEEALGETSRLLGCRASLFTIYDTKSFEVVSTRQDALCIERLDDYKNHYVKIDKGVLFAARNPKVRLFCNSDYMSEAALARDEHTQDFLLPQDIKYFAAATFTRPGGVFVALTPQRAATQGPFSPQDKALVAAIAPHFFQLHRLLAQAEAEELRGSLTTAALESFRAPAVIVASDLELVWANAAARGLIGPKGAFGLFGRRLYVRCRAESRSLAALVGAACGTGLAPRGGALLLRDAEGVRSWAAFVAPLHPAQNDGRHLRLPRRRYALLLLQEPGDDGLRRLPALEALYGLTRQERRLAEQLAAGRDLRRAAAELGIGYETARQYLKAVFGKTGTCSQGQLLRLVLESPALHLGPPLDEADPGRARSDRSGPSR